MSAESAHLSTFGAETETEAEIRSTSADNVGYWLSSYDNCGQFGEVDATQ